MAEKIGIADLMKAVAQAAPASGALLDPHVIEQRSIDNFRQSYFQAQACTERKPAEIIGAAPLQHKAGAAIQHFTEAIPYSVAKRLNRVALNTEPGPGRRLYYAVTFEGGHEIRFYDVEAFPSDSDLGRVALECP